MMALKGCGDEKVVNRDEVHKCVEGGTETAVADGNQPPTQNDTVN